ncbi:MAG: hypothetical protein AAGE01_10865 [Pseudomonadota bacterium]
MTPTLFLALALGAAPPTFHNLEVTVVNDPPGRSAWPAGDGWVGFAFDLVERREGPCCWHGHGSRKGRRGCHLTSRDRGFVEDSGTRRLSERAYFLGRIEAGTVVEATVVAEHCPLTGNGEAVRWLATDNAHERLSRLTRTGSRRVASTALHGLAVLDGDGVTDELQTLAVDPPHRDVGRGAVFWLGEARGDRGLDALDELLRELPPGGRREAINHALHANGTPGATRRLQRIATDDPVREQRNDAVFWLAQDDDPATLEATAALIGDLLDDVDPDADASLFALSEIDLPAATALLERTAQEHGEPRVRQEALFWLAQAAPERGRELAVAQIHATAPGSRAQEAAFTALMQLPDGMGTGALIELARSPGPRETRRQAFFWLAHSDDPQAVAALTEMLEKR